MKHLISLEKKGGHLNNNMQKEVKKEHPTGWYTGIVHLRDLSGELVYVDLKKDFKENGFVDKNILASKMNFSPHWTTILLRNLEEQGFLCKVGERKSICPTRFIYE